VRWGFVKMHIIDSTILALRMTSKDSSLAHQSS
jgi:hypothetical protein